MHDTYSDCLTRARVALTPAQRLLACEMSVYPTPISACDIPFNHLLAEWGDTAEALAQLDASVFVPTPCTPTPEAGVESR